MLRIPYACCAIAAVLSLAPQPEQRGEQRIFRDTRYGISIVPPDFADDGTAAVVMVAQFCAPPANGFAANVNVQRQAYDAGLKEYVALSESQFQSAGWKVDTSKPGRLGKRASHEWTYAASLGGKSLKMRALAVEDGNHVVLVTGTALAKDFRVWAPAFEACLASLKLED
jgi:hypothetical protein